MTKKDFKMLAEVVQQFNRDMSNYFGSYQNETRRTIVTDLAQRLADRLKETNTLFDTERFLEACGLKEK